MAQYLCNALDVRCFKMINVKWSTFTHAIENTVLNVVIYTLLFRYHDENTELHSSLPVFSECQAFSFNSGNMTLESKTSCLSLFHWIEIFHLFRNVLKCVNSLLSPSQSGPSSGRRGDGEEMERRAEVMERRWRGEQRWWRRVEMKRRGDVE